MVPMNALASAPPIAPPIPEKPAAEATALEGNKSVGSTMRFATQIAWPKTTTAMAARANPDDGTSGARIATGRNAAPIVMTVLRDLPMLQPDSNIRPDSHPPIKYPNPPNANGIQP